MILKKQTIWLLTMLSLIVVLSVYYVQSPAPAPGEEVALVTDENQEAEGENLEDEGLVSQIEEELEKAVKEDEGNETTEEETSQTDKEDGNKDKEEEESTDSVITNVTSNDTFSALRMDLQVSRDRLAEEYTQIVASEDTSALMKSEAHDNNLQLIRLAQNEATLETLIKAKGYEDALVMAEEDQVRIYVQAAELTKAEANEILHLTFDRFGQGLNVAVSHQVPAK